MKLKSGRELTHLEIIKRLNLMGIEYNSDIIGKNYYIDLYNEAIKSSENLAKIKNSIEKDQEYFDFVRQNLKKMSQNNIKENKKQNIESNKKVYNNNNCYEKSLGKKGFFSDFDISLARQIMITSLAYDFVEYNDALINKVGNNISKLSIPIQAIKKCTLINIYPEIISKINELIDIINCLISENKCIVFGIIIFLILIIVIFLSFKKGAKKMCSKNI